MAGGAALAVPFWVGRYVPLTDLPQHLAVVAVLRHVHDPAWAFGRFYEVEWLELTPYWTYYLALSGLSLLFPLETASRLYLTAYALAFPLVGILVCRAFGRPAWAGLLMAPLALNANLYYGFIAYVTGVLLLLAGLAAFDRFLTTPTSLRAATLMLLAPVLFFTHVQPFAFLLAGSALLAAVHRSPGLPRRALRLLVLAPASLLFFLPWVYVQFLGPRSEAPGRYNFGLPSRLGAKDRPLGQALAELPSSVAGSFQDGSDTVLLGAWAAVLAVLLLAGLRRADEPGPPLHRFRVELLAGLALSCYFMAPLSIEGQWNIAPRFAWLAALLAVPAVRDGGRALSRAGAAAAVVLTLATSANAVWHHVQFDREADGFEEAVEAVPPGQRVLALIYDNRGGVIARWPYLHFGQYVMVRRGGAAGHSLAKSPPFPVRHRRPQEFPAPDPFRPTDFRPAEQAVSYDYVLARGGPEADVVFAGAAEPRLVGGRGAWRVWRRSGATGATAAR